MAEEIINKIASSGLVQFDLEAYYPREEVAVFDLKSHLFMELILKEKDFREALQTYDWSVYHDKIVAVTCTADAIIPLWAYMLVVSYLEPVAKEIVAGTAEEAVRAVFLKNIAAIDMEQFRDARVVVKGCGDIPIGESAYMEITRKLRAVAKSIMYGEPCSTVPVYKKKS